MTPEQATVTADILDKLLTIQPERRAADLVSIERKSTEHMTDVLAVIEELRALSAKPCAWRYEAGTLYVSNPGGRIHNLNPVSGIAGAAGRALSAPGEWVEVSREATRNAMDKQCRALARRLSDMNLHTLAEAVRSISLKTERGVVLCIYDPEEIPVRIG